MHRVRYLPRAIKECGSDEGEAMCSYLIAKKMSDSTFNNRLDVYKSRLNNRKDLACQKCIKNDYNSLSD